MMTSSLGELRVRWSALNKLAFLLNSEDRRLSTPLELDDHLVQRALNCQVPLVSPLTIGTLLASVLSEIDGCELAMEAVRRSERPGEDAPDPLSEWQRRMERNQSQPSA
jgi:hypothetical protein